ncbi:MAG TPA: methyl-accepting chemotaxis protein [Halothiobacillus sp.]|nr:methyl-accepting chemotaxis protein [Halothiobacillus sp.]
MSIRTKVLFLLGISLALALFISILSLSGSNDVLDRAVKFSLSTQVDVDLARTLAVATTTIKADPINPDTGPLLKQVNEIVHANFEKARRSLHGKDDQRFLDELNKTETEWNDYYKQSMNLYNMAATDPSAAIGMIESVYDSKFIPFQKSFKSAIDLGLEHGAALQANINQSIHHQRLLILIPLGITMTLLLALAVIFMLSLTRAVRGFVHNSDLLSEDDLTARFQDQKKDEISLIGNAVNRFLDLFVGTLQAVRNAVSKNDQVVAQLRDITDKTERNIVVQNQETTQMVTAVEQLSLSFRRVADMSVQASQTAEAGEHTVQEGTQMGRNTIAALRSIDDTVATTGQMMAQLDDAIRKVAKVTQAIQSISEQTTLLALNAAIEAARAGTQGRGFAVVASEVKQLSNRTKSLTIDISNIVDTVQGSTQSVQETLDTVRAAVTRGVASSGFTGNLLEDIDVSMRSVADMIRNIAQATDEQSAVTVDMTDRIDRVSNGSVLMREQMGSVMDVMAQLEGASTQLHLNLDDFKLSHDAPVRSAKTQPAPFDIRVPGIDIPRSAFATRHSRSTERDHQRALLDSRR